MENSNSIDVTNARLPGRSLSRRRRRQNKDPLRLLTPKMVQSLRTAPNRKVRQICYPSSTTLVVAGTGVTYTPSTGTLATTGANNGFYSMYFRMGDLVQASQFQALYDQYKIEEVKVVIIPLDNVSSSHLLYPTYTAVDFSDSSVLTSIGDVFQYEAVQIWEPYKPIVVSIKPRIAVPSGTGFANIQDQWLDFSDMTVQHYGIKGVMPATGSVAMSLVVHVEYAISMRSIH